MSNNKKRKKRRKKNKLWLFKGGKGLRRLISRSYLCKCLGLTVR